MVRYLLTFFHDAIPKILSAWTKVFNGKANYFLDGLLGRCEQWRLLGFGSWLSLSRHRRRRLEVVFAICTCWQRLSAVLVGT
jgi:hypothetical protein